MIVKEEICLAKEVLLWSYFYVNNALTTATLRKSQGIEIILIDSSYHGMQSKVSIL